MQRLALTILLAAAIPASAAAEDNGETAYLDDRSTPGALVRSLYNAINREEYARAWSYFADAPATDLDAYARRYADTEHVDVISGAPHEEGAAGSVYYDLPVAIRARSDDGSERVFAGCYTLRMSNPAGLGEEFTALHIERGALSPTDTAWEEAVPRRCGDGPELPAHDALLERAKAMFEAGRPDSCRIGSVFQDEQEEPESYAIPFNYDYDSADEPAREARLFRFFCYRGAYNEAHVYYLADDGGELAALQFARPELDIRYQDDDTEKPVESITVTGFSTRAELVNSQYDAATQTLDEFVKWRGLGDAFSSGKWAFSHGKFRLVLYSVDAAYDSEQDPETIIDYDTGP